MMKKMLQKQSYSTGFSFSTLRLACLFFYIIIIIITITGTTTTTTASSLPTKVRTIAAISLTSQSAEEYYAAAAKEEEEKQQEPTAQQQQLEPGVKCKNEQGEDVDWFIAYKLPKIRTSSNAIVRAGLAYAYILPTRTTAATKVNVGIESRIDVDVSAPGINASGHAGSFSVGHTPTPDHLTYASAKKDGDVDTAESVGSGWTLSAKGIDSSGSMVGQTLGKVYVKGSDDVAFLTYNDQPPVGPVIFSGGHSKGIIVTSLASGGIWIQHSVPHFPLIDPNNFQYQYPRTGKINGQVFHCISFSSTKDIDDLAKIFEITKPHVVNFSFPTDSFRNALPQLVSIANHSKHLEKQEGDRLNLSIIIDQSKTQSPKSTAKRDGDDNGDNDEVQAAATEVPQLPCVNEIDERACLNGSLIGDKTVLNEKNEEATGSERSKKNWDLIEIRSAGGKKLKAYVKGPSFNEDIYSSWIAPTYKTKLDVQSWLNGPHPFMSNCSTVQFSVYNILDKSIAGQNFSTHNDHSKWAMSLSSDQPLVCISDLNRMEHQLKRGGVTICFTDVSIWTTFSSSIIDVQPCPRLPIAVASSGTTNNGTEDANLSSSTESLASLSPLSSPPVGSVSPLRLSANVSNDDEDATVGKRQRHHPHRHMLQRKVKSRTYSFTST